MPPRRDNTSSDDLPPTVADQLAQLIAISSDASKYHAQTNEQLASLIAATANLNIKLDTHSATTARLVNHVADLSATLHHEGNSSDQTQPPPHRDHQHPHRQDPNANRQPRHPKINLPLFDGTNPLGWIFQADNYYNYYHIPPQERVALSAFHCTGDALSWYQNQADNDLLGTWAHFKRQIELRFGPSTFENHEAALFKLQQTTTVSDYLTSFERLSNRITGLSAQTLLKCFLFGLKPDLRVEIAIQKPTTLHEATGLARLIEDKLTARPKPFTSSRYSTSNPSPLPALLPNPTSRTTTSPTPSTSVISPILHTFNS